MMMEAFVQLVDAHQRLRRGRRKAIARDARRQRDEVGTAGGTATPAIVRRVVLLRMRGIMEEAAVRLNGITGVKARVQQEGKRRVVLFYEPWPGFGDCGLEVSVVSDGGDVAIEAEEFMWRGKSPSEGFSEVVAAEDATRQKLVMVVTDWLVSAFRSACRGD